MTTAVELRCPHGFHRLLAKVLLAGGRARVLTGDVLEVACTDCARAMRRDGRQVARVLHRYTVLGELLETEVQETR